MAFSCFTCISYIDSRLEDRDAVPSFYPSSPVLRSRRAWEVVELAEMPSAAELRKGEGRWFDARVFSLLVRFSEDYAMRKEELGAFPLN